MPVLSQSPAVGGVCLYGVCLSGVGREILSEWVGGGGESGIRTHEAFQPAGFQDQCIRPLCHLSKPAERLTSACWVRTCKMVGRGFDRCRRSLATGAERPFISGLTACGRWKLSVSSRASL